MPVVLITGANRGIGLEFARQYAARGWQVVATCREPAGADALLALQRTHEQVRIETLELMSPSSMDRLADRLGGLGIRPISCTSSDSCVPVSCR